MGFTIMESFMDKVDVESIVDIGTKITMTKTIHKENLQADDNLKEISTI